MGQQIIRQPDGRLAVFSTVTDGIVLYDATAQEVADYFAEEAATEARRRAKRLVEAVMAGDPRKVYGDRAVTWAEALELHREGHGELASE